MVSDCIKCTFTCGAIVYPQFYEWVYPVWTRTIEILSLACKHSSWQRSRSGRLTRDAGTRAVPLLCCQAEGPVTFFYCRQTNGHTTMHWSASVGTTSKTAFTASGTRYLPCREKRLVRLRAHGLKGFTLLMRRAGPEWWSEYPGRHQEVIMRKFRPLFLFWHQWD